MGRVDGIVSEHWDSNGRPMMKPGEAAQAPVEGIEEEVEGARDAETAQNYNIQDGQQSGVGVAPVQIAAPPADDKQHAPQKLEGRFRTGLCGLSLCICMIAVFIIILAVAIDYDDQESPLERMNTALKASEKTDQPDTSGSGT